MHALYILFSGALGDFSRISAGVAPIVGGQNVESMHAKGSDSQTYSIFSFS